MKLFNPKYVGSVMKLYKVVNHENCRISVADLTEFCLEFVEKCTNESLNQIYKNYNSKPLNVNKFYEFMNDEKHIVVSFEAYSSKNSHEKGEQTCIFYANNLLNKTEKYKRSAEYKTEIDIIDLTVFINNFFITEPEIIHFVNGICKIIAFDYGYIFYLEKNRNLITEGKDGVFSKIGHNTNDFHQKLKDVKTGYVPKIYPFNILNPNQIKALNVKDKININDNLYLIIPNNLPRNKTTAGY
jgi:hypothetical protein